MRTLDQLEDVFLEALATFDLPSLVAASMSRPGTEANAIAVGKAAIRMLQGAARVTEYARVIAVTPDGPDLDDGRTARIVAAHPLPDQRSVDAAGRVLDLAYESRGATLDVFVSGGASALICAPSDGISLRTKAEVTKSLLLSGADISAVNVVRRHMSRIKGGGLLRATDGATIVRTFIVSDVLGGEPADVGSGPSVVDPSTVDDARAVLHRFSPKHAALPLIETVKPDDAIAARTKTTIVADADTFLEHMASMLEGRGFLVRRLSHARGIAAKTLADEIAALATRLAPGDAVVRSVEPSIIVPNDAGRGGRATHLAALVAARLPPDVALLVGATDGVDGPSGTGGAVVSRDIASPEVLAQAVAAFDTGAVLDGLGVAFPAAPTGLNFSDVLVFARPSTPSSFP